MASKSEVIETAVGKVAAELSEARPMRRIFCRNARAFSRRHSRFECGTRNIARTDPYQMNFAIAN